MIRALVVDDEPLARSAIVHRLAAQADIEVAGESEDGPQAVDMIRRLRPDIVFLDVQMPGLDGFEVLARLPADASPVVVFVTAYDVHALRAFEVHAIDYLLKPWSDERFAACLAHARTVLDRGEAGREHTRLRALITELRGARDERYPRHFPVQDRERILMVRAESIDAIEAAGNYVQLVEGARRHLIRTRISEIEAQLDPQHFRRIHRSTIVNLDRIREIHPDPHGDGDVLMEDGTVYRLSRTYRRKLLPARGEAEDVSAE